MEKKSVLAKYDIRGIQKFIFRTKKLSEIRAVQNIPEKIIFEALKEASKIVLNINEYMKNNEDAEYIKLLESKGIHVLDRAGGNAYILFECDNAEKIYSDISKEMAFYILKKTYSLELVYACVKCTDNFFEDYETLNAKLGKLKSQMPSPAHITMESALKKDFNASLSINREENVVDNYILKKGIDSHIAIIHIDGNNMGSRINDVLKLKKATYQTAKEIFSSIRVRDRFHEVCQEMSKLTKSYKDMLTKKDPSLKNSYLVHAIIQAGDDITYITRADIALSFTKKFIQLVSEKYMIDNTNDSQYLISACAGIAYIDSHFPFSDGYELAERCCSNAKKRAKKNKTDNDYIGSWIDYEICRHIKDTDLSQSRSNYGKVNDTILFKKPYCVKDSIYHNDFFDFDSFEDKIRSLLCENPIMNRSRAKEFREAYMKGSEYVETVKNAAESRGYLSQNTEFYEKITVDGIETSFASYYDPIEIMDLYADFNINEKESEKECPIS